MSNLTEEEIFQLEIKAKEAKKEKIMEGNVKDKDFWDELAKEIEEDTYKEAIKTEVIKKVETLTIKNLLEKQFPETIWLVENLIPAEGFTAITGTPSSYKSFLTEHLAICLTSNQPFLGHFPVTEGSVLIIDKENPLSLLKERFLKLGAEENAAIYFLQDPDHYRIQDDETLNLTINFIKENNIKLVIIDSFVHIHKGDENDSGAIAATFEKLKLLPCAIVFIHHHRKTIKFFTGTPLESIRGSSDIAAEVESHLAVDVISNGLRIAQYKNRRGELIKPFLVTPITTDTTIRFQYSNEIEEEVSKVEKARFHIIELLETHREMARKTLSEALSDIIGRDSIDKAIKLMEAKNELKIRWEGKSKYLILSPDVFPEPGDTEISSSEQSYLEEIE